MNTTDRDIESLIADLADEVREGAPLGADEHALEDFCCGRLSVGEDEALIARAQGDAELERALDALRPLDETTCERMADAVLERLRAEPNEDRSFTPHATKVDASVSIRASRSALRIAASWALPSLAVAASLLLVLQISGLYPERSGSGPGLAAGASYVLDIPERAAETRGLGGAEVLLDPEHPQDFIFRPEASSARAPRVNAYHGDGRQLTASSYDIQANRGALRVTLGVSALQTLPPSGTLVFVLSESAAAESEAVRAASLETKGQGWQRFVISYRKLGMAR